MRLWHYKLIPALPNKMLISQWRECIAIKRQWEKGTLKHRLVSYVMNYDKGYLYNYFLSVACEMENRKIKKNGKYILEMNKFCNDSCNIYNNYEEHNDRYLRQCYYNLEEKYDRGIIIFDEWKKIKMAMIGELFI
jgi:uncharacterized protein (TIGR02328 family)